MELNLKDRQKLTKVTARKYRTAKKQEKTKILDTFIGQTNYGRKYAIHILANEGKARIAGKKLYAKITHGLLFSYDFHTNHSYQSDLPFTF